MLLLCAGTTGVLVAVTEFFGETEAERGRLRDVVSSVTTDSPPAAWPFLYLHNGEAFGDGGLVAAMLWGTALVLLAGSGPVIYWQMRRPRDRLESRLLVNPPATRESFRQSVERKARPAAKA